MATTLAWNGVESYARGLCALGLCLIRLGHMGKTPEGKGWRSAPPLPEDEAVAHVMTGGNLAVKTGTSGVAGETRVIVLDLDVKHGDPAIATAKAKGWLVPTWTAKTPSGGLHAYYLAPNPLDGVIQSSASKLAPGVDVRGEGGLAVAPGSALVGDEKADRWYLWEHALAPGQVPLAPMPAALQAALREAGSWQEIEVEATLPLPPPIAGLRGSKLATGADPLLDEPGCPEGQRAHECARLAGILIAEEIEEDIALPSLLAWAARCVPPLPADEALATWESIKKGDQVRHPDRHTNRAKVRVTDDLPGMIDQIEAELLARCPPGSPQSIYRYGKEIVYASRMGLEQITFAHLRELIATHVRMKIPGARGGGMLAPASVVEALMDRPPSRSKIPIIEGIVHHPTLIRDGKGWRISEPGYDRGGRIVGLFEPIADLGQPRDTAEAKVYADAILAPFSEFPWWGPTDRVGYLALLLSLVMRSSYEGPSPCFAIRASLPGSGKTLLAQVANILVTGRAPAMLPPIAEGAELRKTLLSIAREGGRYVVIDNATGSLGSSEMAQILTADTLQGRILGSSSTVSVPWIAVVVVTGNNLSFRADMARRVVPIDLKLTCARPESRRFTISDLKGWVRERREMLLGRLLGLALGFVRASARQELEPYGGFEGWSAGPRSAALWALGLDPCATRGRLTDDDDDIAAIREILNNWRVCFGLGSRYASSEVYRKSSRQMMDSLGVVTSGRWDARSVGIALRQIQGRVCNGLILERWQNKSAGPTWSVREARAEEI